MAESLVKTINAHDISTENINTYKLFQWIVPTLDFGGSKISKIYYINKESYPEFVPGNSYTTSNVANAFYDCVQKIEVYQIS